MLILINSVSLVADQSMAAFVCSKSASIMAASNGCIAQARGKRYALQLLPVNTLKYMNNKYKLNNTTSKKHKTQVKYFYIHYKLQNALNFSRKIAV